MDWFLYDNGLRHETVKHLYRVHENKITTKNAFNSDYFEMKVTFYQIKIMFYVFLKTLYLSFSLQTQKDVRRTFFNRNFISQKVLDFE